MSYKKTKYVVVIYTNTPRDKIKPHQELSQKCRKE